MWAALPWQVLSVLYLIPELAGFVLAVLPQHWYEDAFPLPRSFLKALLCYKQDS